MDSDLVIIGEKCGYTCEVKEELCSCGQLFVKITWLSCKYVTVLLIS